MMIKPHVQPLIEQFAFPLMCLMEEEIESFSEDPVEFSRSHFGGTFFALPSISSVYPLLYHAFFRGTSNVLQLV